MKPTVSALVTLAVTTFAPTRAFAHDQGLHKGKATEGQIVSFETDRFIIKAQDGERRVTLGEKTKIEVGDFAGSRADSKAGAHVAVFGAELPGGEIIVRHRHEAHE